MIASTARAEPGLRCTYCHGAFAPRDGPFSCGGCGALLHEGCWYEAARCPSLGCPGPASRRARARRPRPPPGRRDRRPLWRVVVSGFVTGVAILPILAVLAEVVGRNF